MSKNLRILVIGDAHVPYEHPRYLSFCRGVAQANECNVHLSVGDIVDNHATSYHEHDPSLSGPGDELQLAIRRLAQWHQAFPKLKVCIGNHDSLFSRKTRTAGLPEAVLKEPNDLFGTPGWEWKREFIIPAFHHKLWFRHSWAKRHMNQGGLGGDSIICGHTHTEAGIRWAQFPSHSTFSLYTGCGILPSHPAFAYGIDHGNQPVLACATIIDGQPQIHRMWD